MISKEIVKAESGTRTTCLALKNEKGGPGFPLAASFNPQSPEKATLQKSFFGKSNKTHRDDDQKVEDVVHNKQKFSLQCATSDC